MGYLPMLARYSEQSLDRPITVSVVIAVLGGHSVLPEWLVLLPGWIDEVLVVVERELPGAMTPTIASQQVANVRLIAHTGQSALCAGLAAATGDIVVVMSNDGSHNPNEIHVQCAMLLAEADYVIGSRFLQGGRSVPMRFPRRFRNWMLTLVANLLFGGKYSDLCYGYVAFWRDLLPQLQLNEEQPGDGNEVVVMNLRALRCGFNVCEVPSVERGEITRPE